jgi:hypothetical protein
MPGEAPQGPDRPAGPASTDLARLRDRTDELELIISGLTTVALFTLPGWLFEQIAESYTHLSVSLVLGGTTMLTVLMDDRYTTARFEYHIPFLFAPEFERELDAASGCATASQAADE